MTVKRIQRNLLPFDSCGFPITRGSKITNRQVIQISSGLVPTAKICRIAINGIQISAGHLNDEFICSIRPICNFDLMGYTVFEITSECIVVVVGNANDRSNAAQILVVAAMLIRECGNKFLVDTGKTSKVLYEDRKILALLFQISSQLCKNCLSIFTGNISTALNDFSREAIQIVDKLGDFKVITLQRRSKERCLRVALLHNGANDFRYIKIFIGKDCSILKDLIARRSNDIIAF